MIKKPMIRILSTDAQNGPSARPLPSQRLLYTMHEEKSIDIHITQRVYQIIVDHVSLDMNRETGGFLLGDYCEDVETYIPYIVIDSSLEALHTKAALCELEFTNRTFSSLYEEHQGRFPDKKVLGWYHSHPGHGVFLSDRDIFIHENYFRETYQIALVLDPRRNEGGFFKWIDNRIEPRVLRSFYEIPDLKQETLISWQNLPTPPKTYAKQVEEKLSDKEKYPIAGDAQESSIKDVAIVDEPKEQKKKVLKKEKKRFTFPLVQSLFFFILTVLMVILFYNINIIRQEAVQFRNFIKMRSVKSDVADQSRDDQITRAVEAINNLDRKLNEHFEHILKKENSTPDDAQNKNDKSEEKKKVLNREPDSNEPANETELAEDYPC